VANRTRGIVRKFGALHLQGDFCDAIGEKNVSAVGLIGLCAPVIGDGRAVAAAE